MKLIVVALIVYSFFSCSTESILNVKSSKPAVKPEIVQPSFPAIGTLISDSTNKLTVPVREIELEHKMISCACADWEVTNQNNNNDSTISKGYIFIEPADTRLYWPYPDSKFESGYDNILVTGQFYAREDYPHPTYEMEEHMKKARVFRYIQIKRVKKSNK